MAATLLAGCENVAVEPNAAGPASATRGRLAAERLGCGACHVIPGLWPRGTSGPSLAGFAERGLIAGTLPNRPDALAAFLFNPPATVPGTGMPRVPMTRAQAADIAAFLHQPDAR
ncbi:c-type cytochrome [Novosphingobium soli]|uniref:C-type cytochrome n=1 Tax=Novosphingobium soli TaxID=574956 RepID=A0ABV6CZN6_9SPHN